VCNELKRASARLEFSQDEKLMTACNSSLRLSWFFCFSVFLFFCFSVFLFFCFSNSLILLLFIILL
jgi:hypothetical protein